VAPLSRSKPALFSRPVPDLDLPKFFRGDSAFALPKLLRLMEREGFRYATQLKANASKAAIIP